jgi:hypothetical protein
MRSPALYGLGSRCGAERVRAVRLRLSCALVQLLPGTWQELRRHLDADLAASTLSTWLRPPLPLRSRLPPRPAPAPSLVGGRPCRSPCPPPRPRRPPHRPRTPAPHGGTPCPYLLTHSRTFEIFWLPMGGNSRPGARFHRFFPVFPISPDVFDEFSTISTISVFTTKPAASGFCYRRAFLLHV